MVFNKTMHRSNYVFKDGPLAQLVEQGTLNPKVIGSNPIRPTIFSKIATKCHLIGTSLPSDFLLFFMELTPSTV